MDYSKKRWLILIASCFINLCIGSLYAWSVFSAPMAEYLSQINGVKITPAHLTVVFIVANSVGPITMISGGKINDTFGPKLVIFVGGLMFGGGMILSGFAKSVSSLILSYGVITGLGLGMVYGCTISTSIKFFPDKRGFVGGVTTALFGISSVIIPPIAAVITAKMGVISAFKIIGGAFTLIVCISAFFIEKCPDGFKPEGWEPPVQKKSGPKANMDWKEMLKTPKFYIMITLLTCGAFSGLMIIPLASPLARKLIGMSTAEATVAVSALALFNVMGRIWAGSISDKIGRINTLALACSLSMIGLGFLYISGNGDVTTFYIGLSIIGICFGSFMGVYPGFTADQFGSKNNSVNFGIMFSGFAVAGYFGPTIMVKIAKMSKVAFLIAIGFSIAGLAITFIYRVVNKNENSELSYEKM
ncbi:MULTISPECIES: L-lactate MFS transporter [Psychrilyobacter]|uniref:MFS transporter n=1 Tax=Psychrilyobacter piezotolerans TaxID=2293438 RepID=A0ABX9KI05_9FUSO|nr:MULTISPECIES: OFA family MFS transporter [Psychrilyobacter]MCS5422975.1 OFA family MFS transporter [Psychrilyobacter sp. S5]NDI77498.1 OFA family MFS transporter [Psychrilyobacter piezotolerans]RDE62989.1 MFS transporter [Psychrilyobacter sp. S5]REI41747.1 MFS transporter [Psychrilyobacter piezotolerans]